MPPKAGFNDPLDALIEGHRAPEPDSTVALIQRLRPARARGYLTLGEFRAACRWKSPRATPLFTSNTHHRVREATCRALAARNERVRIEALMALRGVSVPMGSAILALLDPRRYGVIDIRVWQLLHRAGAVSRAPRGTGLTAANWIEFVAVIRALARKHGMKARDVERALFEAHRRHQEGRLYDWPTVEAEQTSHGA